LLLLVVAQVEEVLGPVVVAAAVLSTEILLQV
jgi:hypothetical protein